MHNEEDEARGSDNSLITKMYPQIYSFKLKGLMTRRLVSLAPQLISNSTSNLAEGFMNIRCKFDGGKLYKEYSEVHFNTVLMEQV